MISTTPKNSQILLRIPLCRVPALFIGFAAHGLSVTEQILLSFVNFFYHYSVIGDIVMNLAGNLQHILFLSAGSR